MRKSARWICSTCRCGVETARADEVGSATSPCRAFVLSVLPGNSSRIISGGWPKQNASYIVAHHLSDLFLFLLVARSEAMDVWVLAW
jgi:hypothetical protein